MKKITNLVSFAFLLFLSSCVAQNEKTTSSDGGKHLGYSIVFSEEFNSGKTPNPKNWSHEIGFVRNKELQWYQPDNAFIEKGLLVIEGKREKIENSNYEKNSSDWRKKRETANYSSSCIKTKGKFEFKYGILEVKARIDTAMGLWPAIWTLGVSKPWPSNGEIDQMEFYRKDGKAVLMSNAAWKANTKGVSWDAVATPLSHFVTNDSDWSSKFHVWKMEWTETYLKLFLDDELLNEVDLTKTKNFDGTNPFHQPQYILLNLAIGSNGGNPSFTSFPRRYEVDYVRVYQKTNEK